MYYRGEALKALLITGNAGMVDVDLWVTGGGSQAQAECLATALADAFVKMNP